MNKLFTTFLLLSSIIGFSQDAIEEIYGYSKVYNIEDKSQDEIHSLIIEWIGQNLDSPQEAIQFNGEEKIIVDRRFKMSPKIIQTAQNTTSNYRVSSTIIFSIKENKFRMEMKLKDLFSFDGKKGDPNTNWKIPSNQIDESYIRTLLTNGYMNVKQFGLLKISPDKGDAKTKKAKKYVDKEIKKGVYIMRIKKVSNDLNNEVLSVYKSIEKHFENSTKSDW